jgi:hypothetical protein
MNENEKAVLRIDYLKTWITTLLAIIAGEVALLNTFYKGGTSLWILYSSMALFVLAIIFCMGASEALVNKVAGVPTFRNSFLKWWAEKSAKSEAKAWVYSGIAGACIGSGIIAIAVFLLVSKT